MGARPAIAIRNATVGDADRLQALLRQMGYNDELAGFRERLGLIDSPTNRILVAVEGDIVVGLVSLMMSQSIEHPAPNCRLSVIVVDEAHRRRGVARALMGAAEKAARAAGCFRIELTTAHDNGDAQALYRAIGWEETGLRFKRVF